MTARGIALALLASLSVACINPAAQAQQPLSSWEFYTDLRGYLFEEPEPVEREGLEVQELRARAGIRYNRFFAQHWLFDAEARAVGVHRQRDPGDSSTVGYLELKRLHLQTEALFGNPFLKADIGRNRLQSERGWYYDDDMELLRLGRESTLLDLEAGIAGWLWDGRIGADTEGVSRDEQREEVGSYYLFGRADYQWHYRHFVGIHLVHEDFERADPPGTGRITDPDDLTSSADLTWLGIHLRGIRDFGAHALEYQLDVARVEGDHRFLLLDQRGRVTGERAQDLDGGFGWDARLIARFDQNRYAVGVGHASGDGGGSGGNGAFRQPQVATDKDDVLGLARYRYYGEALGPRLSNLTVTSLWAGKALTESFWLEAAYHRYRQRRALPWLFSERGVFLPNGVSDDIGHALDLVAGGRLREDMDLLLVAGLFDGGDAFDGVTTDKYGYRFTVEFNVRW